MNPKLKRLALPIALVGVGTFALIGCIPLPGDFRNEDGGPRPEERIGKAGSERPLALGHSTLDRVVAVLGPWSEATADERVVSYRYRVRTGTLVLPLCFMAETTTGYRHLVLRFGDSGALESFKVYRNADAIPEWQSFKHAQHLRSMEAQRLRKAASRD